MLRYILATTLFAAVAAVSHAQPSLPSSFQATTIHSPEGGEIFVRSGGSGPIVVLLHGYDRGIRRFLWDVAEGGRPAASMNRPETIEDTAAPVDERHPEASEVEA